MARRAEHLERSADAVGDFQGAAVGREAGVGAAELDHQAGGAAALQAQAAVGVEVRHDDLARSTMWAMSVSSQMPSVVSVPPRTTMPLRLLFVSALPRTSGP